MMNDNDYSDILGLPHHEPDFAKHPRMSMESRAAQFAPFAALTGYENEVNEVSRLTERRIELSEQMREELDQELRSLENDAVNGKEPLVEVVYFVADSSKSGGEYLTAQGRFIKIDRDRGRLLIEGCLPTPINDILSLRRTE